MVKKKRKKITSIAFNGAIIFGVIAALFFVLAKSNSFQNIFRKEKSILSTTEKMSITNR